MDYAKQTPPLNDSVVCFRGKAMGLAETTYVVVDVETGQPVQSFRVHLDGSRWMDRPAYAFLALVVVCITVFNVAALVLHRNDDVA